MPLVKQTTVRFLDVTAGYVGYTMSARRVTEAEHDINEGVSLTLVTEEPMAGAEPPPQ